MPVVIGRLVRRGVRQRDRSGVGLREIEGRGEIATDRAAPRRDVGLHQPGVAWTETSLDEPDERGMVEDLGADPAPLAPRRYDDRRHADPKSVGARGIPGAAGKDLVARIDRRQTFGGRPRRGRWYQVIKEAVVLVVGDDENG